MAIADTNSAGDNPFWLNLAAENVYGSAAKRENSVKGLTTVILWTFGLFASGGILSIFGGLKEIDFWALVSFGIAFFFLALSYMLANRALYPVPKALNPAEAGSIKTAFSETVKKQTERFKWAAGFTATGFFFLALGILLAFWTVKKPYAEKPMLTFYMKTGVEKAGDSINIPVTIMDKKNEAITLSFINTGSFDSAGNIKKLLFSKVFYTDTSGRLYYSYHVKCDSIKKILVKATVKQIATADTLIEMVHTRKITIPR